MNNIAEPRPAVEAKMIETRRKTPLARVPLAAACALLSVLLWGADEARAQWVTNGTNINNTNTGNVGVGTTAPVTIFQIRAAANINMGFSHVGGTDGLITAFNDANNAAMPLILRATSFKFQDGTLTERFRVSGGLAIGSGFVGSAAPANGAIFEGNVGFGTTAPQASLHVSTSSIATGSRGIIDEQTSNDNNGALLIVRKSRAGAAVQNGDSIGNLYASGFDGTGWLSGSRIRFGVDGAVSAGVMPTNMQFITGTNNSAIERIRITSAGLVGIGTTTPIYSLDLSGGTNGFRAKAATSAAADAVAVFENSVGIQAIIRGNGFFGVGTASPSAKMDVRVAALSGGANTAIWSASGAVDPNTSYAHYGTTGDWYIRPATTGGKVVLADNGGAVGVGTSTPGAGFKLDVAGNVNASGLCLGGACKTNWSEVGGTSQWANGTSGAISYSAGFVGVGTTTPGYPLTVKASTNIAPLNLVGGTGNIEVWKDATPTKAVSFGSATPGTPAGEDIVLSTYNGSAWSARLSILNSNGNVGVGTTAPAVKFAVGGAGTNVYNTDIWTENNIHVQGNELMTQGGGRGRLRIGTAWGYTGLYAENSSANIATDLILGAGTGYVRVGPNASAGGPAMNFVVPNGSVGIGTATPGAAYKLDVAGSVNASGLCLGGACKTNWSEVGGTSQWANGTSGAISYSAGFVGVGTSVPGARLDVGAGAAARGSYSDLLIGGGGNNPQMEFYGATKSSAIAHDEPMGGMVFYTNGPSFSPSLFVGNAGNVGVGTTAPASKLFVGGGTAAVQALPGLNVALGGNSYVSASNGTVNTFFGADSYSAYGIVGTLSNHPLGLRANNTLAVTVMPSGDVGVGTASPTAKMEVAGNVRAEGFCIAGDCKTAWSQVGGGTSSQWAASGSDIYFNTGNVGIGTTTPRGKLEVAGGALFLGDMGNAAWGNVVVRGRVTSTNSNLHLSPPGGSGVYIDSNYREAGGAAGPVNLHVSGDVVVGGNISAKYQDVAEWVPTTQKLQAGTVVVLDTGKSNHVVASGTAYDMKVAGVVSAEPGIILGVAGEGKVKVATTGRVMVKVDARLGAIKVGDLLVTSGVEGVAMKSVPVDLGGTPIHRPGTIIGKALEPLAGGVGEILVLLSLQ